MKAYKPDECDFFILNLLNEYNGESLCAAILQDAQERHKTFNDEMEDCIRLAKIFSNAVLTQTGRCLVKEGLAEEQPNKVEEINNAVDFKLTEKGKEIWVILKRQFADFVQVPGWTKTL